MKNPDTIEYTVQTFVIDNRLTQIMQAADFGQYKVFGSFETIVLTCNHTTVNFSLIESIGRKLITGGVVAFWNILEATKDNIRTQNTEIKAFRHPKIWELSTGKKCGFIKCEIAPIIL